MREHVFDLLALVLEREPVRIAARAFEAGDAYVRGTSLEYLETVLPPRLFALLRARLPEPGRAAPRAPRRRGGTGRAAARGRDDDREPGRGPPAPGRGGRARGATRMTTSPAVPQGEPRILLVDDDATSLAVLRRTLDGRGFRLFVTRSGEEALEVARRARPLLVLMDVVMPGLDGYEACRRLKARPPDARRRRHLPVVSRRCARQGPGAGGGGRRLRDEAVPGRGGGRARQHPSHARAAAAAARGRNAELARELAVAQQLLSDARSRVEGPLVGSSPAVRVLRESIAREAESAEPVLLTGPADSGHESTARAIHHASPRGDQAFIHVNCGLLPPDARLLPVPAEARDGSPARLGLVELAERGTVFLEEVQRLPGDLQERLARVLEAAVADRERGATPRPDARVVASCSAPLEAATLEPKLLAALERRQLRLPSLAERAEDVPELARYFVRHYAQRVGSVVEGLSESSLERLARYRWPGGVRELQSLLERAVASAREPVLEIDPALLDEGFPLGSYRLLEKVGSGGMGEVWRARHQLLARPCAIKLVRPERLGERGRDQAIERFRREARAIARLASPHTVRLFDFGVSDAGSPFYVMELLDGLDLHTLVERFGPLPPERAVAVLRQACRSLAEAHQAGLLHRDVKPQNVLLCRLGLECDVAKVVDFGLARSVGAGEAQITAEGAVTGTPAYMPPERVLGEPGDERSDIYALGGVAFYLLTGRAPFAGEPMAVMIHHVRTPPPAPSSLAPVPALLEAVVLACLEKDPARRPPTALDLWRRLGEVELKARWTRELAEAWWREHAPGPAAAGGDDSSDEMGRPPGEEGTTACRP